MTFADFTAQEISPLLMRNGYRKKEKYWRKNSDFCTLLLTIHKGYGGGSSFQIYLGATIHSLSNKVYPRLKDCHFQFSYSAMIPNSKQTKALKWATDLGDSLSENLESKMHKKTRIILAVLEEFSLPYLNQLATKEGCIEAVRKDDVFKVSRVSRESLKFLGLRK